MARRPAPGRPEEPTEEESAAAEAEAAAEAAHIDEDKKAEAAASARRKSDLIDGMISDDVAEALGIKTPAQRRLLAEAAFVFGFNPDPRAKPRELFGHRFDDGDPYGTTPIPAYVSLVTAGGLKIRYPIDDATEDQLRNVFNAYKVDKEGTRHVLPLPEDLTLPPQAIDGRVRTNEHQYRKGYLREGGKSEGDRRAALDQLKRKGAIR